MFSCALTLQCFASDSSAWGGSPHEFLTQITCSTCRVVTRTLCVPFDAPSVGPADSETEQAYREMEELLRTHHFSKAVGWIVSLGEKLRRNVEHIEGYREKQVIRV